MTTFWRWPLPYLLSNAFPAGYFTVAENSCIGLLLQVGDEGIGVGDRPFGNELGATIAFGKDALHGRDRDLLAAAICLEFARWF